MTIQQSLKKRKTTGVYKSESIIYMSQIRLSWYLFSTLALYDLIISISGSGWSEVTFDDKWSRMMKGNKYKFDAPLLNIYIYSIRTLMKLNYVLCTKPFILAFGVEEMTFWMWHIMTKNFPYSSSQKKYHFFHCGR